MLSEARERLKGKDSALMTAILVAGVLYFARDIFIPLALATLLSFLLAPAANQLEGWKLKRLPAALIVVLVCVRRTRKFRLGVAWASLQSRSRASPISAECNGKNQFSSPALKRSFQRHSGNDRERSEANYEWGSCCGTTFRPCPAK